MKTSTLRPGLLVSLKTAIVGNVNYQRYDIEPEHVTDEGTKRAIWETKKTIEDPNEHEKAVLVRSKCRSLIVSNCAWSTFGLLCPEDTKDKLDTAIAEAQQLAQVFNETATRTRVNVYVIAGRVEQNDLQAVRAINSEVRDLLTDMERGLKELDVKKVREAATRARSIGQMLTTEAQERIKDAIEVARTMAKQIVKAGEEASTVIDHAVIRKITDSRTAFLDLEDGEAMQAPTAAGRAIDLKPDDDTNVTPIIRRRLPTAALEME